MKQSILLNIKPNIHIECIGTYFKAEDDVNLPERFEIDEINSTYINILPLIEYCNSMAIKGHILEHLEQLCLEKIEK